MAEFTWPYWLVWVLTCIFAPLLWGVVATLAEPKEEWAIHFGGLVGKWGVFWGTFWRYFLSGNIVVVPLLLILYFYFKPLMK